MNIQRNLYCPTWSPNTSTRLLVRAAALLLLALTTGRTLDMADTPAPRSGHPQNSDTTVAATPRPTQAEQAPAKSGRFDFLNSWGAPSIDPVGIVVAEATFT